MLAIAIRAELYYEGVASTFRQCLGKCELAMRCLATCLIFVLSCGSAAGLVPSAAPGPLVSARARLAQPRLPPPRAEEYTEVQRLRAEAESPFSQVRLFAYPVLFAAAGIATYFGATGLLASAAGLREASPTGIQDLIIDLGSMGTMGFLWKREVDARDSKLKRIAFGSTIAALRVSPLVPDADMGLRADAGVSLSDLRRGRGQARRVVLLAASESTLNTALQGASASAAKLAAADFLIVPLIASGSGSNTQLQLPRLEKLQELAAASPALATIAASVAAPVTPRSETQPALPWVEAVKDSPTGWPIAMPQSGAERWTSALSNDLTQAAKQDPSIVERGFTIILKKNGKISNRRLGTPDWEGLVADVEGRKLAGLDVENI